MNNTSEINPSLYGCYYVYESLDDFKLYLRYPDGDIEYTQYDLFIADDKTIIAFKDFNVSKVDYNYILISDGKESILQWSCYEFVYDQLHQDSIDPSDAYCILNSVSMPNLMATNYDPLLSYESRCDTNTYGVTPYALTDGQKPAPVDSEKFNGQTIKSIVPFINVCGASHIEYFKVDGLGSSYKDWPAVSGVAKTLMGAMKLIIEWASLNNEPFNINDEIVVDSKNFMESLELGQDIVNEINEYQEDMPVYRYLKNVNNARTDFDETTTVGPLLFAWLCKKLRYVSLNSLVANHPENINIDSEVLATEKTIIETVIYEVCEKLELNSKNLTAKEVIQFVNNQSDPSLPQPSLRYSEQIKAKKALLAYIAYN